ncbi:MAG TPA: hypothetical protein VKE27_05000 [Candidatus Dormibacteraeota bacterium]|nr:hypothetical protein [Candidatus Dormibacteraeota bacterium]
MENEPRPEGDGDERESADSILEALLVEDAELKWDPKSGKPRVRRRRQPRLDSPPDTA